MQVMRQTVHYCNFVGRKRVPEKRDTRLGFGKRARQVHIMKVRGITDVAGLMITIIREKLNTQ